MEIEKVTLGSIKKQPWLLICYYYSLIYYAMIQDFTSNRQLTNNFFLAFSFLRFFINSVGFVTLVRMSEMKNMFV
jgi:hypothetical protein